MLILLLTSMSFTILSCKGQTEKVDVEDDILAIQKLIEEWSLAAEAGNLEKIMDMYIDDIVRFPPDAPVVKGKKAVEEMYRSGFELFTVEAEWPVEGTEEIIVADGWAFHMSEYIEWFTPKAGGDKIEEEGKVIVILQKQTDGSWKFAREIWNRNSPVEIK